jgi:3-oxoacyl-[acyl-carrier-protein] synthase-1
MMPVYLAGRALASVLGPTLDQALTRLNGAPTSTATTYPLPDHGTVPYLRISDPGQGGWDMRARTLITQVAANAGASQARHGALFIATSCQDGASAEHAQCDMDFHTLSHRIGEWLDWVGPVFLISSACTSSMQALLSAIEWLRAGHATEALVLGLELDNQLTLPGFAALQLLSASRCKPFAVQRDGLVLGEAVAALRLSTRQTAPWVLRGGANVVDGTQPTGASATAVALMCRRALAASGVDAANVDLIKVQAAGSPGNDATEAQGLQAVFSNMPALLSLKPLIGHCMGASGAAEIALLLECLERGYWPNYPDTTDPTLGVQLAQQVPLRMNCVLATILGFGGSHSAVVLERISL